MPRESTIANPFEINSDPKEEARQIEEVANLYEVLLPARERMKEFYVGSRDFDPKRVGFENKDGPGTFLFDTSKPGNSNAGHIYGNIRFTIEQRQQLVEYMKTL